jgi:hypothetical protein
VQAAVINATEYAERAKQQLAYYRAQAAKYHADPDGFVKQYPPQALPSHSPLGKEMQTLQGLKEEAEAAKERADQLATQLADLQRAHVSLTGSALFAVGYAGDLEIVSSCGPHCDAALAAHQSDAMLTL